MGTKSRWLRVNSEPRFPQAAAPDRHIAAIIRGCPKPPQTTNGFLFCLGKSDPPPHPSQKTRRNRVVAFGFPSTPPPKKKWFSRKKKPQALPAKLRTSPLRGCGPRASRSSRSRSVPPAPSLQRKPAARSMGASSYLRTKSCVADRVGWFDMDTLKETSHFCTYPLGMSSNRTPKWVGTSACPFKTNQNELPKTKYNVTWMLQATHLDLGVCPGEPRKWLQLLLVAFAITPQVSKSSDTRLSFRGSPVFVMKLYFFFWGDLHLEKKTCSTHLVSRSP